MTWTAPDVEVPRPPNVADERTSLETWLDHHRATLLHKCSGLTAEQLKLRSVEPSSLSLLGLVRHMAEVEQWWFRRNFAGVAGLTDLYCTEASPDGDFDDIADADAEKDWATFVKECEQARKTVTGRSLDDTFKHPRKGVDMDLRWVYVHMIEEYARHNGHADFLRERIDGVVEGP